MWSFLSQVKVIFLLTFVYEGFASQSPGCPTVMCFSPCPEGQYLVQNEQGCETCDCYDPCENHTCESGKCKWVLDENTVRPVTFCESKSISVREGPLNCPTVMCFSPCPKGQYLVQNEQGCETCDCYDPCEGHYCENGKCQWILDESTSRPVTFCEDLSSPSNVKQTPSCPTVMCHSPCPIGQYLVLNEQGCETCECYDPCEKYQCDAGECHWILDEATARPLPFCVECKGGQIWAECTGGSDCVATCANPWPLCTRNCVTSGCQCPVKQPIFHQGQCIQLRDCEGSCEGGQVWTTTGSEFTATCKTSQNQGAGNEVGNISRCQCPEDRPIWDTDRSLCVAQNQCMNQYYREKNKSPDIERLANAIGVA